MNVEGIIGALQGNGGKNEEEPPRTKSNKSENAKS